MLQNVTQLWPKFWSGKQEEWLLFFRCVILSRCLKFSFKGKKNKLQGKIWESIENVTVQSPVPKTFSCHNHFLGTSPLINNRQSLNILHIPISWLFVDLKIPRSYKRVHHTYTQHDKLNYFHMCDLLICIRTWKRQNFTKYLPLPHHSNEGFSVWWLI